MKKNLLLAALFLFSGFQMEANAFPSLYKATLPPNEVATLLGWMPTCNLCGGFYQEPEIILSCTTPPDLDAATTTITAEHTVCFSATDTSHLEGRIIVTQPGRKMTADEAYLYRDPETHEISQISLLGDVHYYESGKHLIAQSVFVDLQKKRVKLDDVIYRLAKATPKGVLNSWGQAKCAIRRSSSDIVLTNASYTTCSPVNQTWKLLAKKLHIDKVKGKGEAFHSFLLIHNIPIIWMPYFSFPVNRQRKTGFLFPTSGYSNDDGFHIKFPYYLNLAPNYDATIIPSYSFRRGVQFEGNFRYLTCHNAGHLNLAYIPYDSNFAYFRRTAPDVYGVTPSTIPFLNRIKRDSNSRGGLSFLNSTTWNAHWWGSLDINLVSDDYYIQDFARNPYRSSNDQLPNEARINYASENWRFLGRLLTFQTLHPINQQPVLDQYSRLPQLTLVSDYPELPFKFDWQLNTELVNFAHPSTFIRSIPMTTGQRIHLQPAVSYPMIWPSAFLTPKLTLDATQYDLADENDQTSSHVTRILPQFDIDSGIYLERQFSHFTQTLEPHLFYLYVPYKNQDDIPIFDTTLPPYSFPQLFRINRFVGYDRIGDANQISFAITTRLIDSCTGYQRMSASIGQTVYLNKPKVTLTPNCGNDPFVDQATPLVVGELTYNITQQWDGVADAAIDSTHFNLNNASMRLHYHSTCKHLFNIGYDFVRKGDTLSTYAFNSSANNLSRFNAGIAWQINDHWQALGSYNYNLSHNHYQAYLYGIQYDSCCWAMRIVASRILTAENINYISTYQSNFYFQIQLKGLGNLGNSDPGAILSTSIFGYCDNFRG